MKAGVITLAALMILTGAVMTSNPAAFITGPSYELLVANEVIDETTDDTDDEGFVYESALPASTTQLGALDSGAAISFQPLTESPPSPDIADLPAQSSSLGYLLASSFDPSAIGSGKVWAIDADNLGEGHVLLAGLAQGVGLCFDPEHDFLYVYDRGEDEVSRIYQYKTTRSGQRLTIQTPEYVVVYEGFLVSSCAVDAFGNLYFSVSDTGVSFIAFANYLDLWSGLQNEFVTLYSGAAEQVSSPIDIAVQDVHLLWVNGNSEVVRAPGRYILGKSPEVVSGSALSIAASANLVFQASNDGAISTLNSTTWTQTTDLKGGVLRAMCTVEEQVYVADVKSGKLFVFSRDTGKEKELAVVTGLSDVACVPASGVLRMFCWGILLLAIA